MFYDSYSKNNKLSDYLFNRIKNTFNLEKALLFFVKYDDLEKIKELCNESNKNKFNNTNTDYIINVLTNTNNIDIFKYLIQLFNIELTNKTQSILFKLSIVNNKFNIMQYIHKTYNINLKSEFNWYSYIEFDADHNIPFVYASCCSDVEIVKYLHKQTKNISEEKLKIIRKSVYHNKNINTLKYLLNCGIINIKDIISIYAYKINIINEFVCYLTLDDINSILYSERLKNENVRNYFIEYKKLFYDC
jgi:hypothetical protein